MEDKEFLGREPIGKLLFKLAVPTVVAQLINMLYNIVDRIYIGHMSGDGTLALTGVGVCMPVIMLISAFAALVSSGGAPRAAIFMGKKDPDSAENILGNCVTLLAIISVVLTAVIFVFSRDLFLVFGASENTIEYAVSYMRIYCAGTIFVQMTMGLNMFITTQGKAKIGMLTVIIGALCNIILDPVFIFVMNMGVKGAALATIVSQAVSCIWCIIFLTGRDTQIKIRKEYLRLKGKVILPCVLLGLATFIMQMSESIISVCFNSSLLKYGGDIAVGSMTICVAIMQFAMLPLMGIGQGAQPITGFNYGAQNVSRVKESFKLFLKVCVVYSTAIYCLVMIFPNLFASIFTADVQMIEFASQSIRIYCGAMFIFGIQIACQMTFVSLGKAVSSIAVAVVRKFVLLLPLIYIVPVFADNKTNGVFLAEPIADIIAVIFTVSLFAVIFKKSLNEIDKEMG